MGDIKTTWGKIGHKPGLESGVALIAGIALTIAMAACAPTISQAPDTSSPSSDATRASGDVLSNEEALAYRAAELTFNEGLKNISQRYIDPIDMDELALSGLNGLITIDPNLQLDMNYDAGLLYLNKGTDRLAQLHAPKPGQMNTNAWAKLIVDVLRTGRTYSQDFQNADNERVYEAVFDGMLSSLDVFSRYSGADEARANRAKRDGFGGIGVRFTKTKGGILVTHVSAESPATDAGLKPGDVIVRINETLTSGAKLRDVAKLLRGPVGSPVTLTVMRLPSDIGAPDRQIDFSLKRAHIVPETVHSSVANDLMLITVSSFNKNTSSAIHEALRTNDLAMRDGTIQGIIIDLRGNPGGLLTQAVNVADLFLNEGRIISTFGRHPESQHDYQAGGEDMAHNLPLTVLVDGDSASAAEIVASALQDQGRAVVIGSASYGKGTVQTVIRLPNDGEVTLTWSRFISPSGYAIHGLGVMPAVCATNTPKAYTQAASPVADSSVPLSDAILAPEHIDASRNAMDAWRAAGLIFDGRRTQLRTACPAKTFKPGKDGDLLIKLAQRIIHDPSLYNRAVLLSQPISTASR